MRTPTTRHRSVSIRECDLARLRRLGKREQLATDAETLRWLLKQAEARLGEKGGAK